MKKSGVRKSLTLKKDLGLFQAVACGVGIIIGAGIYVLIGSAAGLAGNALWISFLISAAVAAFTGMSYAELSSIFSDDAGEYLYVDKALNKKLAFLAGYSVLITGFISAAAVALGLAGYLSALLPYQNLIIIAALSIVAFSFINFYGIRQSALLNVIFTILEVGGLLLVIALAAKFLGKTDYFIMPNGFRGVFSAAALIFFAYLGFESIIKLSEETKNAKKIIPKALLISILITTVLYVLVAVSVISVLSWEELAVSKAPIADVASVLFGGKAFLLLAVIALFSTGNTILIILVTTSRILYGMGKDIKKLKFLTKIHSKKRTPYIAVFITMLLSLLFVSIGKIDVVASITNFAIFVTFILVNLSAIILRYKIPDSNRGFKMPFNLKKFPVLALLGVLSSLFMIFNLSLEVILGGMVLLFIGFILSLFLYKE